MSYFALAILISRSKTAERSIVMANKVQKRASNSSKNHCNAQNYPDPIFQVSSVASANDCTGITVTVPKDDSEANSVAHLAPVNVTSEESR